MTRAAGRILYRTPQTSQSSLLHDFLLCKLPRGVQHAVPSSFADAVSSIQSFLTSCLILSDLDYILARRRKKTAGTLRNHFNTKYRAP